MKVVVINLDKSTDRLLKIKTRLDELRVDYERFPAIYGREINDIDAVSTFSCSNLLCNHGMIGCALSHIEVIKKFIQSDDEYVCIMEDDIIIHDAFPRFLNDIETIYQNLNFDIVSLFCLGICSFSDEITVGGYTFTKPIFPLSAACYVLSKKGARKILDIIGEKVNYHIDFTIATGRFNNDIQYYVLTSPSIISTNDAQESTMGSNSKSIILNALNFTGLHKVSWILNVPLLTIKLKYTVSIYALILIAILCLGLYKRNIPLIIISVLEIVLINTTVKN